MKKILCGTVLAALAFGAEGMKVITKYKVGGEGRWDYVTVDSAARRLYVSHGTSMEILDADSGKPIHTIGQLHGVHGIAVAPELNKGFITNGQTGSITTFDLKTFEKTGEPAVGKNPDAVCYDSRTKRVVYIEETSEIVELDLAKADVTRRASLAPCEGPSGLSIDVKNKKLFPVCSNKMMAVVDIPSFKVIATPAIGAGTDGGGFDPGLGYAYSSNGRDATLTIVKLVNGKYEAVDNVPTEPGARTMAVDEKTHRVFLLAAEMGQI